jgi:hypothetical protein
MQDKVIDSVMLRIFFFQRYGHGELNAESDVCQRALGPRGNTNLT